MKKNLFLLLLALAIQYAAFGQNYNYAFTQNKLAVKTQLTAIGDSSLVGINLRSGYELNLLNQQGEKVNSLAYADSMFVLNLQVLALNADSILVAFEGRNACDHISNMKEVYRIYDTQFNLLHERVFDNANATSSIGDCILLTQANLWAGKIVATGYSGFRVLHKDLSTDKDSVAPFNLFHYLGGSQLLEGAPGGNRQVLDLTNLQFLNVPVQISGNVYPFSDSTFIEYDFQSLQIRSLANWTVTQTLTFPTSSGLQQPGIVLPSQDGLLLVSDSLFEIRSLANLSLIASGVLPFSYSNYNNRSSARVAGGKLYFAGLTSDNAAEMMVFDYQQQPADRLSAVQQKIKPLSQQVTSSQWTGSE